MIYIYIFVFGFLFFLSPTFRCIIFHPFKTIKNMLVDITKYIKHKKYNNAKYGYVYCYTAKDNKAFGCGKTLTMVHKVVSDYKKYNNKPVWDEKKKKFVTQKFYILSNVEFTKIPYIKLESMKQFVSLCEERYKKDIEEDVCSIIVLLVDECGSAFNSRSFRENFDGLSIKTLLTARHYKAFCLLSTQRFTMCDAIWRQICNKVIACNKFWRFQRLSYYDAYEMENAQNPALVKPYAKSCWFISNKDFEEYDTYQLLSDIKKKCEDGDMLTEAEILANQCNMPANMDVVMKKSRKYIKQSKKLK